MTTAPRLALLDYCRGGAVLMVLALHSAIAATHFTGHGGGIVATVSGYGYLGVDLFFALSGFLMSALYGSGIDLRRYLTARAIRIFVPYWPIGLGMAATYTLLPGVSHAPHDWGWFASLTLLPGNAATALLPAWSLRHELVFYALFGIGAASGRLGLVMALWTVAILLFGTDSHLLSPRNLSFVAGVALAFVVSPRHLEVAAPKSVTTLASASYAIYLIQTPVIAIAARIAHPSGWEFTFALAFAASILAGIAYNRYWEAPALRFARDFTSKRGDRRGNLIAGRNVEAA